MSSTVLAPPPSRTDWVVAQLREAIVSGQLPPGQRLRPRDLEARYAVSATPVREAIQRLVAERLLIATPQRGATVAPLDPQELEQLYELRLLLEPMAVERSLLHADAAWSAEVDQAYQRLAASEAGPGNLVGAAAFDCHNDFHRRIRSRCDSPWLLHLVEQLTLHSERYRRLRGDPNEFARIAAEHAALHAACLARDAPRVLALATQHLSITLEFVRQRIPSPTAAAAWAIDPHPPSPPLPVSGSGGS